MQGDYLLSNITVPVEEEKSRLACEGKDTQGT